MKKTPKTSALRKALGGIKDRITDALPAARIEVDNLSNPASPASRMLRKMNSGSTKSTTPVGRGSSGVGVGY